MGKTNHRLEYRKHKIHLASLRDVTLEITVCGKSGDLRYTTDNKLVTCKNCLRVLGLLRSSKEAENG